jgi:hypothetical protein
MLAGVRSHLLFSFVVAFSMAACLPVQAQVNGVPASVTSIGFGGNAINGVRASVTSLGPPNNFGNNWSFMGNCCAGFFWPSNPNTTFPGNPHHHKNNNYKDRADSLVGVVEPAYIPYPVPYTEADDESPEVAYSPAVGPRNADPRAQRSADRAPAPKASDSDKSASDKSVSVEPEEPVAAQPSTVLVFKDGHKSDVLNYAIVGDTLFDFSAGHSHKILLADLDLSATRKANDDRGVDFQIPASATRNNP